MTQPYTISEADDIRCSCRISNPQIRKWAVTHLLDANPTVELVDEYPDLVIYGDTYRELLYNDLRSGSIKGAAVALCLEGKCCDSYLDLFRLNVRHIIYPGSPFAIDALHLAAISARETGDTATNHVQNFTDHEHHLVQTAQDYDSMQARVESFVVSNGFGQALDNVTLVLREALTNALFHSYREPGSHSRKYSPETFLGLYDEDSVEVTLSATPQWFRLSVRDNSGSLGPLSVANSLDRHRSEQGVLDSRGRGFYLMRHLSHRMIIRIQRGLATTVDLYFLRRENGPFSRHFELLES